MVTLRAGIVASATGFAYKKLRESRRNPEDWSVLGKESRFSSSAIVTNKSNYVMADEVALADISNPIRSQSDSTPFTVLLSRQPCNIMRPVAFALKILLYGG